MRKWSTVFLSKHKPSIQEPSQGVYRWTEKGYLDGAMFILYIYVKRWLNLSIFFYKNLPWTCVDRCATVLWNVYTYCEKRKEWEENINAISALLNNENRSKKDKMDISLYFCFHTESYHPIRSIHKHCFNNNTQRSKPLKVLCSEQSWVFTLGLVKHDQSIMPTIPYCLLSVNGGLMLLICHEVVNSYSLYFDQSHSICLLKLSGTLSNNKVDSKGFQWMSVHDTWHNLHKSSSNLIKYIYHTPIQLVQKIQNKINSLWSVKL